MAALLLSSDLMLCSQVAGASQRAGVEVVTALSCGALLERAAATPVQLVILDLSTPGADPGVLVPRLLALEQPPRAIVAFGPHVQTEKLAAAKNAGCNEVFSRGQFSALAEEILTRYDSS